ncbi:MAG: divergent polysaccharide deacetylase family protein [Defluviitaleaceae bacterium]|nr:divergent polysaccharide deacetylase family protein [Defluviitaleaceae bacterium]
MQRNRIFVLSILILLLVFGIKNISFASAISNKEKIEHKELYVAIIIDDFGANGSKDIDEMISLEIPFTGAVIPGFPHSLEHMEKLKENEKGIIVHMPMEAKNQKAKWDTPLTISNSLSVDEVKNRTKIAIEELNIASGLNNHMGSSVTANKKLMQAVIETANDNNLLMIDSVTTEKSTIKEICDEMGLNHLRRDVFLDGDKKSVEFVEKRMKQTLEVAKKQGYAIAIGHVGTSGGTNTVNGIKNTVEHLQQNGVKFVTIDELHGILHGGSLRKIEE